MAEALRAFTILLIVFYATDIGCIPYPFGEKTQDTDHGLSLTSDKDLDGGPAVIEHPTSEDVLVKKSEVDDDETMEADETIVFKPLFRYKKTDVQKKRVYSNPTPASGGQRPAPVENTIHRRSPPPILVYDPKTGAYYPATYSQYIQFQGQYNQGNV